MATNSQVYAKKLYSLILDLPQTTSASWSEDEDYTSYTATIETRVGRLCLFWDNDQSKLYHIHTRFDNVKLATRSFINCNPHSGKWNHYITKPYNPRKAAQAMLTTLEGVL